MTHVPTQSIRKVRRWLSFSLRSLLVFVTVLCVVLGICLERARRQHEIVKLIRDSGGYVEYEIEDPKDIPTPPPFWHSAPYGQDLADCIESVTIEDRRLLPQVARLYGVTSLTVEDSELADEDLGALKSMRCLTAVCLVGEYNFVRVQGSPGIWRWHVDTFHQANQLTDKSLEVLSDVRTLQQIEINGRTFSAQGLKKLLPLRNLSDVYIYSTESEVPLKSWLEPLRQMPALDTVTLHCPKGSVYSQGAHPWVIKDLNDYWTEY